MISCSETEVLRYLGFRGQTADEITQSMIQDAMAEMGACMNPLHVKRICPLSFNKGTPVIEGIPLPGNNIAKNLKGCTELAVFACTIGMEADRLIKRASISSMAYASVLQAAGAAYVESYCDSINEDIIAQALSRGLYARPRYSPGYGDFPLDMQKTVFSLLDPARKIGLALTDSLLMIPSKSITAFIGLSPTNHNCILEGCEACAQKDTCQYSRTGGSLWKHSEND